MKQMTVINPNMATLGQERMELSPFGLLSRLFTLELSDRVRREEGLWQQLPLEFLEDGERDASDQASPAPEIYLNLDLKILTKALREEQKRNSEKKGKEEKKDDQKSPAAYTAQQRILERILLRERELRIREANIARLLIQTGPGYRQSAAGPEHFDVLHSAQPALRQEWRETAHRTEVGAGAEAEAVLIFPHFRSRSMPLRKSLTR